MSSISSPSSTPIDTSRFNTDKTVGKTDVQTGKGVAGVATTAPDSPPKMPTDSVLASLSFFMSNSSNTDTEVLLVQVAVSMRDTEAISQKSKINTDQESKKAEMREKEKKLEDAAKKLEESRSNNLFDKIKLAFEWLGALLAVVGAVLAQVANILPGGQIAAGLAIAGAVTALIMVIDSTVKVATGMGIAGNIEMAVSLSQGKSESEARASAAKADMGFGIAVAVLGIALSVVGAAKDPSSGIRAAVNAGTNALKAGVDAGLKIGALLKSVAGAIKESFKLTDEAVGLLMSAKNVSEGVKTAKSVMGAVSTANQVAQAGVSAAGVGIQAESAMLKADAKKLEADAKRNEAAMQILDEMIDQALSRLMASGDRFNAMLDAITDGMQDRSQTLSRAQFGA
ncbi:hypothetical protein ASG43_00020 [Aureimonas sp. Leaf454]|uniref:type III secretion system translocon subunit SctE n=1 Tax=Aureimonas sp. Leaf454 TaxID=1736381 RepID=UPI00070093D6|nr:type III secretion system translocon subunit SctE [Aureimonas sp. Leaf454]KQT54067.1 hypothetical protein ASG43_00020 [Aureimonas sp. Leaf454]